MRILVVEDDMPLCSFLRKGLESEHYAVDAANDGEQARFMLRETDYDLAVLDLNLPKMDGIEVLRYIRPLKPNLPILILTSRSRVEDRVQGLDCGADDYLSKPFSFSELSARVRAILRRGRTSAPSLLRVADLALDRVERRVERGGKKIELTSKEFALLEYLMRNAGRRITRTMIVEHVWNVGFDTATNVVDVYINYLFAGTKLTSEPFAEDASSVSGVTYNGNQNVNSVMIGDGHSIPTGVAGDKLFADSTANVFGALQDLSDALKNNDKDGVASATQAVRDALSHVSGLRVTYGSGLSQLDSDEQFLQSAQLQAQTRENDLVGIDPAKAITQMQQAQYARDATLAAVARSQQVSLLDYLK